MLLYIYYIWFITFFTKTYMYFDLNICYNCQMNAFNGWLKKKYWNFLVTKYSLKVHFFLCLYMPHLTKVCSTTVVCYTDSVLQPLLLYQGLLLQLLLLYQGLLSLIVWVMTPKPWLVRKLTPAHSCLHDSYVCTQIVSMLLFNATWKVLAFSKPWPGLLFHEMAICCFLGGYWKIY